MSTNLPNSDVDVKKLKTMNDKEFIKYVKNNFEIIENIIIHIPQNMYKRSQIHPYEIFDIIVSEDYDVNGNDSIDTTILRDYLIKYLE
jgi:hypothetical protein